MRAKVTISWWMQMMWKPWRVMSEVLSALPRCAHPQVSVFRQRRLLLASKAHRLAMAPHRVAVALMRTVGE
jgi:hypothetical protein